MKAGSALLSVVSVVFGLGLPTTAPLAQPIVKVSTHAM